MRGGTKLMEEMLTEFFNTEVKKASDKELAELYEHSDKVKTIIEAEQALRLQKQKKQLS